MVSAENLILFTKWISGMPKKFIDKYLRIYVSNVEIKSEFEFYKLLFNDTELMLNSLLFDLSYISKSAYEFDLIIFVDVCKKFTLELINDIKINIINPKGGEIWVFCHDDGNTNKYEYVNEILNQTNFRSSTVKLSNEFSLVIIK
jgi:hypothetical protein